MSYVQKVLMPGEIVVATAKLHWIIFVRPFVLIFFGLLLLVAPLVGAVFLFVGFMDFLGAFIRRQTTELAVTNKRVIAKFGFIRRSTIELGNRKVESFHVEQGILGRIFNFGTLIIKGSGGTNTPIVGIASPLAFRSSALSSIESPA